MFEVTTKNRSTTKVSKTQKVITSQKNRIPKKLRPFVLSLIYTLFIGFISLLFNGILEIIFNQKTEPFSISFYFSILFIVITSFILPYKSRVLDDDNVVFEEDQIGSFQVERKTEKVESHHTNKLIYLAKVLTLILSTAFFMFFYISGQSVEKFETLTIHNINIEGVDSVKIAIRISRNTRDSATPGKFKTFLEPEISKKGTYIYEEYTYGFPYKLLAPQRQRDAVEGKKYLEGKRAKIFVKWYGDKVSTKEVEGKLKEVFESDNMDKLLIDSFGKVVKEENKR
ncbi:hypothetical protein [Flammeovirga kamogawensis]|uniref:Uncharacterized protein n=1 Tax=Flammeovirga kamogawensis TaxID=373891 RepID=A0ABX8GTS3_9BACT|nr:hypothetical protein [Flammeovirga kamogawensis]MBB6462453.1 hypothetical protein [Flammeovirga kamogawensis]QWG06809.1 hypothetical protein KM029_16085 [Flammeovirga kamogawensis]TRX68632.1 hypothetical protein EO216_11080 [Flammeovirga kamogawensis]